MIFLAAEPTVDVVTGLTQFGPLGIFTVVMVALIRILLKREQERADRLEQEVTRLNGIIQEKTIPALLSATEAVKASQDFLRELEYKKKLEEEAQKLRDQQKEEADRKAIEQRSRDEEIERRAQKLEEERRNKRKQTGMEE